MPPPARPSGDPENEAPREIGAEKDLAQHVGNAGFGLVALGTVAAGAKKIWNLAAESRLGRHIPGLNLGVAAVESCNAARKALEGEPVVAMTHAGNAAGCLGAILDERGGLLALGFGGARVGLGVALGMVGGALGLAAGTVEIRQGLALRDAGGSSRTLAMGVVDLASGSTFLVGAALVAAGIGGGLGPALLLTAGVCDLTGIAVDYLGSRLFPAPRPPA